MNPILTIDKTAPATANPGQNIIYTVWINNTGTGLAIDITLTEDYPVGTTFVTSSIPPGFSDNTWFLPPLAPGDSSEIF